MSKIHLLPDETIDRIAAGEVIERPAACAKELIENAIDAGADAVTIEIRGGGTEYLRVTDNGSGIPADEIRLAFTRHATSKIRTAEDLVGVKTLGFRGEALASMAAVSRMEVFSKTRDALSGVRYRISGGTETSLEEAGVPDGTTVVLRDLFYNTPARAKFLKTAMTEGAYVSEKVEQLALSHPDVSFRLIINGQMRLSTSGSGVLKDVIHAVLGRQILADLIPVEREEDGLAIGGYIAGPQFSRSNRRYEHYFVNGRYIKSRLIARAAEEGYGTMLMQHCFPFLCFDLRTEDGDVDVNVHPAKAEVRFSDEKRVFDFVKETVRDALRGKEMIVRVGPAEEERPKAEERRRQRAEAPEPFEQGYRSKMLREEGAPYEAVSEDRSAAQTNAAQTAGLKHDMGAEPAKSTSAEPLKNPENRIPAGSPEQMSFLSPQAAKKRTVIGQAFATYWIVEFGDELFIMDQHAAHEKVLFERLMKQYRDAAVTKQLLAPAAVLTTDAGERAVLREYADAFAALGFDIEAFGDTEYRISAVPYHLSGTAPAALLSDLLGAMETGGNVRGLPSYVHTIATEACKAAVKGGGPMSRAEFDALFEELMQLEDPYHCPHGRPTLIRITKYELEKRFRRIV